MGIAERKEKAKKLRSAKDPGGLHELFVQEGIQQVSIRRIAEITNTVLLPFTLYFKDKDEIFSTCQ